MTVTASRTRTSRSAAQREERCAQAEVLLEGIDDLSASDATQCRHDAVILGMDLADMVARKYSGRGVEDDDLVQVARMALVKAVAGYRAGRGHSFAAYAVPTVSGEVKRYFRDKSWAVRPPRRLQERRVQLLRAQEVLRHELGREPSREEVADHLGFDVADVDETAACFSAYNTHSLDAPMSNGRTAMDLVVSEDDASEKFAVRDALTCALHGLSDREMRIVHLRFVDELTQSQIGVRLGVSQMQISRLLSSILDRLRLDLAAAAA